MLLAVLGVFGASLFFGDSMITPAISVLSAIEGVQVAAPSVVGHPQFECAHRTHMNTVENLVVMIPFLWIASAFYGGQLPFWFGLLWVVSRILYAIGYAQTNPQLREPGAGLGYLAQFGLLVLSVIGLT